MTELSVTERHQRRLQDASPAAASESVDADQLGPAIQRPATAAPRPAVSDPAAASASFGDAVSAGVDLDPFSRRLDRRLASEGGSALPAEIESRAGASFGTSMRDVRVHADAEAGAMAAEKGFQAFSYGSDLFFQPGAYRPDTDEGRFVMMHELGHVAQTGGDRQAGVQGKVAVGDSSEDAEVDADRAAAAALAGRGYTVQRARLAVRGFGATNRDGNRNDIVHQNQTENSARRVGFDLREQSMIYSGNWQMDMNQFLIPAMRRASPAIYAAMDLMHTLHFGYPIGGSPQATAGPGRGPGAAAVAEFGGYDPAAHIDNPGGLTGNSVNAAGGNAEASANAGQDHESYADSESRYRDQYHRVIAAGHTIRNAEAEPGRDAETSAAFAVDESGIPIYMQTSRNQLKQRLHQGIQQAAQGNRDRGLRYGGEALHIMQDYYAHSNFCEIAMNTLLRANFDGRGQVAPAAPGGQSLVQVLELSRLNPALANQRGHQLNSYVHARGARGGVDADHNMTVAGRNGQAREVMATGTFTLEDTAHSIREKVALALSGLNPFEASKRVPSEKVLRLITWLETNPTYFPLQAATAGRRIGTGLQSVMPAIDLMMSGTGHALEARGTVDAVMERGAGALSNLWHRATGDTNAAAAATAEHEARARSSESAGDHQHERVNAFRGELHRVAEHLAHGSSLRELYEFGYGAASALTLENMARMIPLVGDRVAELVRREVAAAKEWLRQQFEAAWHAAVQQLTAEMNAAVALALGSSEVSDRTGARGMTQPTHTDIAKDFDAHQHETEDRHSVIEEIGQLVHRADSVANSIGAVASGVQRVLGGQTGVVDALREVGHGLGAQVAANPGAAEHGHDHEHRHGGAWLAPLANVMAHRSSEAILREFRSALSSPQPDDRDVAARDYGSPVPARGVQASGIDAVVDQWFAHPDDCRERWQGTFMDALQGRLQNAGVGLSVDHDAVMSIRAELARRIAQPPSHQAPNEESTIGNHGGQDGHHDHGDHDHGDQHDHPPSMIESIEESHIPGARSRSGRASP